jgi:hypothetical protein
MQIKGTVLDNGLLCPDQDYLNLSCMFPGTEAKDAVKFHQIPMCQVDTENHTQSLQLQVFIGLAIMILVHQRLRVKGENVRRLFSVNH